MTDDTDLMTLTEAARLLGYTNKRPEASVSNLIARGKLAAVSAGAAAPKGRGYHPGRRLVRRADVLALRDSMRQQTAAVVERAHKRLRQLGDAVT